MFLGKELKSRENPWRKLGKSLFLGKVAACRSANLQKVNFFADFYKDFANISYPLFVTTIFKEHPSVDESWMVLWDTGVLGILKCHMFENSKNNYFLEYPSPSKACFLWTL